MADVETLKYSPDPTLPHSLISPLPQEVFIELPKQSKSQGGDLPNQAQCSSNLANCQVSKYVV